MKNVIIIGSGPAGITAGVYLNRAKIENIIITNNQGSLKKADLIENYYGFENPITGEKLIENGVNQYLNLGGTIINDEIVGLTYEDKLVVKGLKENYKADIVVIATGVSRLLPSIKGLSDDLGISYCAICDAFFYRDKDVVVLGNGSYAITEAKVLEKTAKSVTILTNNREITSDTNINVNKDKIREITKIDGVFNIAFENGQVLQTQGIFVAEGIAGATALAKKIGAKIDNNKIVVNDVMKTNIPNLYAIGDCIGGILQISKAIYDGTVCALNIIKENKKE
jgi:thioredoxin reductase (NADPH)